MQKRIGDKSFSQFGIPGAIPVVRLSDIVHQNHMSNADHIVLDIHDSLKAYYKVARKRFVDSVCMQAANYFLVNGPDSPLKIFTPTFVISLSDEKLGDIAGEKRMVKRRCIALQKEIDGLEAGWKVLA
jgi:hypothetical protein